MVLNDAGAGAAPRPVRARAPAWALKPIVFVASCLPLVKLAVDALRDKLTANPVVETLNRFGFWTLTLLVVSLAITPLKIVLGWKSPARVSRMVGLFAFFYATLHFATYAVDQAFDLRDIGQDIVKRPFIAVGFAAFVLLVPLALTSTNWAVRRLGFRRWKLLHRLVYVVAALAILHFVWRVKADLQKPIIFATIIAALFAVRIGAAIRGRKPARPQSKRAA